MDERERYRRGMSARRAVLGAAHVGRPLAMLVALDRSDELRLHLQAAARGRAGRSRARRRRSGSRG